MNDETIFPPGLCADSVLVGPLDFELTDCDVEQFMSDLRMLNPHCDFIDGTFRPVDATLLHGFVTVPIEASDILNTTFWLLKHVDVDGERCGKLATYNSESKELQLLVPIPPEICRAAIILQAMEEDVARSQEEV